MKITEKMTADAFTFMCNLFEGSLADFYTSYPDNWYINFMRICYNAELSTVFDDVSTITLTSAVYHNFFQKWNHLTDLFMQEYNPIENYRMTESMFDYHADGDKKETYENYAEKNQGSQANGQTLKSGKQVTAVTSNADGVSITTVDGQTVETTNYQTTMDDIQTDRKHDSQKSEGTSAQETLNAFYNTHAIEGSKKYINDKLPDMSITDDNTNVTVTPTNVEGHKGKRAGNIGVTTTQQMAESEIEYANKILLIEIICRDVAEFLSGGVYE